MLRWWTLSFVCMTLGSAVFADTPSEDPATKTSHPILEPLACIGIENAYRVADDLYCGSEPNGAEAFASLHDLGIRTIVSVDGDVPDLDGASHYHMRYVHLPLEYDGINSIRREQLVQCAIHLEKPIYVHCHHGKHRGPTAAAYMLASPGRIDSAQAVSILKRAGTSHHYSGLYRDVRSARPIIVSAIENHADSLPETTPLQGIKQTMVKINRIATHLDLLESAGWQAPPQHPDLDAESSAVQIAEHFRELVRSTLKNPEGKSTEFINLLSKSEIVAKRIAQSLQAGQHKSASQNLVSLRASCRTCHARYRD